jgi:hypothetical protein
MYSLLLGLKDNGTQPPDGAEGDKPTRAPLPIHSFSVAGTPVAWLKRMPPSRDAGNTLYLSSILLNVS